ncbi:MAG: tetratricopeptide repeat protein [Pseudomonadota bacterium]
MTEKRAADASAKGTQFEQAVAAFEAGDSRLAERLFAAVPLSDPNYPLARYNLAVIHQKMGRSINVEATIAAGTRALPVQQDVWMGIGQVRSQRNRYEAAARAYETATSIAPNNAKAWTGLAEALRFLNRLDGAIDAAKRAVVLDQNSDAALAQLLYALMESCDWKDLRVVRGALRRASDERLAAGEPIALRPDLATAAFDEPAFQRQIAEANARRIETQVRKSGVTVLESDRRSADGRLTIGYLSAGFGDQPTSFLTRGLYKAHDRKRFKVIGFSLGGDDGSDLSRAIEADLDEFIDVSGLSDIEAVAAIRRHQVDILIDLHGFLQGHRAEILAYRPAPIAVNFLGFRGTTGGPLHDYIVVDPVVAPDGPQNQLSECPVIIGDGYHVNDMTGMLAPDHRESRQAHGLSNGPVYCSFCPPRKIDPHAFDLWCAVLREVPGSQLWLLDSGPTVTGNLRREAMARQIAPERLVFGKPLSRNNHIRRLSAADIGLDTTVCSGHLDTVDCLLAGLPVITRPGESLTTRTAASLLSSADLSGCVAKSDEDFVAKAITLGRDEAGRRVIRAKLLNRGRRLPLFDITAKARALEAAFIEMMRRHRAGEPPAAIRVVKKA